MRFQRRLGPGPNRASCRGLLLAESLTTLGDFVPGSGSAQRAAPPNVGGAQSGCPRHA